MDTLAAYRLTKGGTPRRLVALRAMAARSVHNANPHTRLAPNDWRGARSWTLATYENAYGMLSRGSDGQGCPIWYAHDGEQFRGERDASDCTHQRHSGWYTGTDGDGELAIGIVARLPHGRWLAGYRWTSNGERVYFPGVFDDEGDAARMADEHARVFAESAREDAERFDTMTEAETLADEARAELETMLPARNASGPLRLRVRECITALRKAREAFALAVLDYEGPKPRTPNPKPQTQPEPQP